MAYIPSECTQEQYRSAIYNADSKHKCYLAFNGVEYEDIDEILEKITIKSNIIDTSSKIFSLSNLISKSIEIRVHDIDLSKIQDQIELKIGTYINEEIGYVYVPIGIFNLQETPTTSNGITTIKARDNSVKLDNGYNAKPLLDSSELTTTDPQGNEVKIVTKMQLLENICITNNITCGVNEFRGMEETIGIYDSSISGRTYVSYLAEQSGCFAYIDRHGALQFIKLDSLSTHTLPFEDVSSFTNDTKYTISKTIYESGVIKYESSQGEPTNDILYLDSANPYINTQNQINEIHEIVNGFSIDSFKIDNIYGNPSIDPFDFIETMDENNNTYKTLGQNTLIYNGKLKHTFDTQISKEKRKTNVSQNSNEYFKKYVKTTVDNEVGSLKIEVGGYSQKIDNITNQNDSINGDLENIKGKMASLEVNVDGVLIDVSDHGEVLDKMQYSFGTQALRIGSSTSEVNSLFDNTGVKVYNYEKLTAVFNNKGSGIDKLIVTGTAQLGYLRVVKGIKNNKKVTQIFHLENLTEDLNDLVGDE
jgi:hypothetical protein